MGSLSWYALFVREFAQALDAAERALKDDPDLSWVEMVRAHALIFLDRGAEAREVYLAHKDKRVPDKANTLWQQLIAEDFAELRKAGLDRTEMAEIEAALGIAKR